MDLKRRDALALAAGVALAGAASESASACSRRPPGPFTATRAEKRWMAAKIDALRLHWNSGTIDRFLREHCTEQVRINLFVDRNKGGTWSEPLPALELFRERYKRINSAFPDIMIDPRRARLFSIIEFEPPLERPPGPDEEITLCASGPPFVFAISMGFEIAERARKSVLPGDDRIISAISFRDTGQLAGWFDSNRI